MKTTPYKPPSSSALTVGGLSTNQEFLVYTGGKDATKSLFEALYSTVWSLRAKVEVKVYFSQGDLIFHHDGQRFIRGAKDYVEALQTFEACLVADYRLGAREALAARDAEEAQRRPQAEPKQAQPRGQGEKDDGSASESGEARPGQDFREGQEHRQGRRRR